MPRTTTPSSTRDDARIRECIAGWARALRTKDINALMADYAPDFEAWFASVQGIDYEIRALRLAMNDDVAFGHYLGRVKCTRVTGERTDYRVRVTMGFQKMNGRWMVTHEHVSVPFTSRETMRAALASSNSSVPE
jgi:ketosteroid isomerase-like protein